MEMPQMLTSPLVGGRKPVTTRMVVDFPAPLGPRNPRTSPLFTVKERSSTAFLCPNCFVRLVTSIMVGEISDWLSKIPASPGGEPV